MKGALLVLLALAIPAAATHAPVLDELQADVSDIVADPESVVRDPNTAIDNLATPNEDPAKTPAPPQDPVDPGFADRIREAFHDQMVMAGMSSLFAAGLGILGFALVTRYVKPEEALANPQRSMLYGFIRGNPGVHLKRLSDEFGMKTSSILWHIRKLENAELVRSDRANGFRVFYPTAGGQEMKVVSRATTALQNENAHRVFDALVAKPGVASGELARGTGIHAGTVRWHLRKLREFGLVQEIEGQGDARYFPTPLGTKAAKALHGTTPAGTTPMSAGSGAAAPSVGAK